MFTFFCERARVVVGSGPVIGSGSVIGNGSVIGSGSVVSCGLVVFFFVAFKRFHMNLGKHFESDHLGTNFFVKDTVSVGTDVGIGIGVGAVVGIGTDVRAVVVIVAEAAEVRVSVGTIVGIGTEVSAFVVFVAGVAEVTLTGSIVEWEVISEVVGTDVVAKVGTFVRADRGAIAEKDGV